MTKIKDKFEKYFWIEKKQDNHNICVHNNNLIINEEIYKDVFNSSIEYSE